MAFPERFRPICFILPLLAFGWGCPVRKTAAYRFTQTGSRTLLLTPAVPDKQPAATPIALRFRAPAKSTASLAKCSVTAGSFGFSRAGKDWLIHLPKLLDWEAEDKVGEIHDDFDAFLREMESLERDNCLVAGSARTAVQFVQESMPGEPGETLYYRYRYRAGDGFFDMGQGVRLKIERAHFRPGTPASKESVANYLGVTKVEYKCVVDDRRRIAFRPAGAAATPETLEPGVPELPEARFASRLNGMPYYRLFVYTDFVPDEYQRAAMLVGAATRTRLDEITRVLKERPETGCAGPALAGSDCVVFEGRLTVSAEIEAFVNGRPQTVSVGTTVMNLVAALPEEEFNHAARDLHVERLFRGGYVPVQLPAGNRDKLYLPLIGGDKVSW